MASETGSASLLQPEFSNRSNAFSALAEELSPSQHGNSSDAQLRDALYRPGHTAKLGKSEAYPHRARNAVEAASKRRLLVSWLQRMIGPLNIPHDPSQEDLRLSLQDGSVLCSLLNKVNPGILPSQEENSSQSSSPSRDNVRKFLSAAADMKLSLFDVLDLEQGGYSSSSCERIMDCLLSLKVYYEWKQGKESSVWRHDGSLHSLGSVRTTTQNVLAPSLDDTAKSNGHPGSTTQKSPYQPRKRWVIPEYDSVSEANMPVAADYTMFSPQSANILHHMDAMQKSNGRDLYVTDENYVPSSGESGTGLTSTHIHHISQKFREILRLKARQDSMSVEHSAVLNSLDNFPSQSLSGLVTAVLGDKQQEEVAGLVEYMLKKVMEEFERRLVTQNEQVVKLKNTLKEHLMREDRLASRAKVLETLAAGTGEEVKIVSSQLQKMKMEKRQAEEDKRGKEVLMEKLLREREEREALVENLRKELDLVKKVDQEHFEQLELEKHEMEQMLQAKLNEGEVLLEESKRKVQDLEAVSAVEMSALKRKDEQYQSFVVLQLQSFQSTKSALLSMKRDVLCMQDAWQEELENLEEQLHGLVQAASGYHKVLAENRQLYNEVQDLKGNIRVYCRVRPFLPGQAAKHSTVEFIGENGDMLICNPLKQQGKDGHKMFNFNKVFRSSATQEEVFLDTRPLIRSVLDGFNVCIFAYGQTGSGKTYTMSGPSSLSRQDWGVNYRALDDLFHISQSRKDVISYEVGVQMIEIYNEQVRDLLFIDSSNRRLEIRNNSQMNGLNVPDASMLPVNSTTDVFKLMKIGQKNRAVGATALNEHSSRSHSVLTVHVRGIELASGSVLHGCLHLVDLAGSERVDRSEATGDRLKEAQHINKSLSALGDVVSALAQKSAHVPYRNSKLTQLLQDSLGGQAKTLMFVHISPDVDSYGETISTLKFAERVASVELGAARSNKESRELRDLKEQVAMLKEVISKKDTEIDRLQTMKVSSNESMPALEKSKAKLTSGVPFQKSVAEAQEQKLRRQTVDMTGHKEKRLMGRLLRDSAPQDVETVSFPLSSTDLEELHSREGKEAPKMPWNGASNNRMKDSDTSMGLTKQKGDYEAAVESEALSKQWRDRIQSSTDSSLFGTASVDDISYTWDSFHGEKNDLQHSIADSVVASPRFRSVIEKDRYLQAMVLRQESFDMLTTRTVSEPVEAHAPGKGFFVSTTTMRSKIEVEHESLQEKDLDTTSSLSDGDTSQAGSEASLSSMAEQKTFIRKGDTGSKKTRSQRKLSISDFPRPSRGEWKSLNSGQTLAPARRFSTTITPALGSEHSSSKRPPSVPVKQIADGGAPSFSSDGISAQGGPKTSKRWL